MASQGACQCIGIASALFTAIFSLGGFILLLAFHSDFDDVNSWSSMYTLGIAGVCSSSLTSLICTIYFCVALSRNWTVFGFIEIQTPHTDLKNVIFPPAQPPPNTKQPETKPEVTLGADTPVYYVNQAALHTRSVKRVNAYEIQHVESVKNKAQTDWDPDTILKDDEMF